MTAIILYATSDEVKIMTDRAFYSDDGTIGFFGRKAIQLHDHPIILAMRGDFGIQYAVLTDLHTVIPNAEKASTSDALEAVCSYFFGLRHTGLKPAEFLIAAITESGTEVRFVALHDGYPNITPFIAAFPIPEPQGDRCEFVMLGPKVGLPAHHRIVDPRSDLEALCIEAMTLMRGAKTPPPAVSVLGCLEPIYAVGGGIDCITLNKDGVTFSEVLTWPDVIGQKISPATCEAQSCPP